MFYPDSKKYLQIAESWKNNMYDEIQARELVIRAGLELIHQGLVARTWGNVSARISDTEFIITPSGMAYDTLRVEDLVKVKIEDCSYEGDIKPSSEKGVHAAVYSLRKDANFVIHTHQFFASALAADEHDMDFAPCADYGLPGTGKLKKNLVKSIAEHENDKKFLMAKHGALIIGESFDEAFELSKKLEDECRGEFIKRIPSIDTFKTDIAPIEELKTEENPFVIVVQNEYINECCHAGITVKPYIDDFAQIVGPNAFVVKNRRDKIASALKNRNAVLVNGIGAICTGKTADDAEAVGMIVSKNCAAACYVRKAGPMSFVDARLQRYIYLKKYSKIKDSKE